MKPYLFALAISMFPLPLAAQESRQRTQPEDRHNAVYIELGGPGYFYSLGYEYTWFHKHNVSLVSSTGFGYLPLADQNWRISAHIEQGMMIHLSFKSTLELSTAFTAIIRNKPYDAGDGSKMEKYIVPQLGYRHFYKNDRVFLKFAWSPLIDISYRPLRNHPDYRDQAFTRLFWIALGIGYKF